MCFITLTPVYSVEVTSTRGSRVNSIISCSSVTCCLVPLAAKFHMLMCTTKKRGDRGHSQTKFLNMPTWQPKDKTTTFPSTHSVQLYTCTLGMPEWEFFSATPALRHPDRKAAVASMKPYRTEMAKSSRKCSFRIYSAHSLFIDKPWHFKALPGSHWMYRLSW